MSTPMSEGPDELIMAVTDLVRDIVANVFGALDDLRAATEALIRSRQAAGTPLYREDLAGLLPAIEAVIQRTGGLAAGAGFVPVPGTLADEQQWLEWWLRGEQTRPLRRLVVDLDPSSDHYLDFTRLAWYDTPLRTGRRHITGPYVDYLCTGEYSLTFTMPVTLPSGDSPGVYGVVGADVYVSDLEPRLLPHLARLAFPASLVNAQRRVVMSTSPMHTTGSLIRQVGPASPGAPSHRLATNVSGPLYQCGDSPLFLMAPSP
ncbi:cache domain-containing protein [Streptomyces sp. NPDC050743]|uniref:cache domain-containing protein n=1 Tax=Streptomyces sp. NPDC050743 TaxID=3365634 RepID=UPI00379D8EAD